MPRGAHFQVYSANGGWKFGVRNYNSISGHVLASQLCATGAAPVMAAATTRDATRPAALQHEITSPTQSVPGTYKCVQTPTLYLRNYPAGQAFNQLYQGQTFSVYEFRDSGWARGYAFGHVNSDKSGYAAP